MHDVRAIRHDPAAYAAGWRARGLDAPVDDILALDATRREVQTALQQAQARRKDLSGLIGRAKAKGEPADALMGEVETLKGTITERGDREAVLAPRIDGLLAALPTIPAADVPA